jgi:hypothetical protein
MARSSVLRMVCGSRLPMKPRERRAAGKVVLSVVVCEDELAEIARAGYADAASTDRKTREAAVGLFLADTVWGLMQ